MIYIRNLLRGYYLKDFLLCLFLGVFGAHKFYEGRVFSGLLYLLTGGLFGIGWMVDCFILFFRVLFL